MFEDNFIENELIILTKQTMDIILSQDNPAELIAVYSFYYYTAKWQKTNRIKCTTSYVAKGLKISETKVRRTKKRLIELGVIEDVVAKGENNQITGHYIKMNYIFKKETVEKIKNQSHPIDFEQGGSHPNDFPHGGELHSVEKQETNALSSNNLNALNTGKKKFVPPTVEEVREYCEERKNKVDPERFVDYYTSNGWMVGKSKMKDWKAAVRNWERRNFSNNTDNNKQSEPKLDFSKWQV